MKKPINKKSILLRHPIIAAVILGSGLITSGSMYAIYREDSRLEKIYGAKTYDPTTMTIEVKSKDNSAHKFSISSSYDTIYGRCMDSQSSKVENITVTCKPKQN